MMPQATTFGRRGIASPAQVQFAYRPAPAAPAQAPAQAAVAEPKERSLAGYFVWLLFRFDGRLSRVIYRYCRIVANLVLLSIIYGLKAVVPRFQAGPGLLLGTTLLLIVTFALMIWTTLAMQVKRRHDRDKSWPWLFVGFIPVVGPIWVLIETCWMDGTPGYNRFDDPAEIAARTFA